MHKTTIKHFLCGLAGIGAICAAPSMEAATPDPVFWSWGLPVGNTAQDHPNILPMVRIKVDIPTGGATGAEAAAAAMYSITGVDPTTGVGTPFENPQFQYPTIFEEWTLGEGEICLLFQNWANHTDVWYHASDEMSLSGCDCGLTIPSSKARRTPWCYGGVEGGAATGKGWTEDFIDEWNRLKSEESGSFGDVADPARCHQDDEGVGNEKPQLLQSHSIEMWECFTLDDRYDTSPSSDAFATVYGFSNKSLFDVWDEDGADEPDCSKSQFHDNNREWAEWGMGAFEQIAGAVLEAALFDPLAEEWSNIKCSNWWTSADFDDSHPLPQYFADATSGQGSSSHWYESSYDGAGDSQALVQYAVRDDVVDLAIGATSTSTDLDSHPDFAYEPHNAAMRIHREVLNRALASSTTPISPWISLVGRRILRGVECDSSDDFIFTKDFTRRLLAMNRARGVDEFLLWYDSDNPETQECPTDCVWDTIDERCEDQTGQPCSGSGAYCVDEVVDTEANWNAMADVIDQVWANTVMTGTVIDGTQVGSGQLSSEVEFALDDIAKIDSEFLIALNQTNVEFAVNGFDSPDSLYIVVEVDAIGPARDGKIYLKNHDTNRWDQLKTYSLPEVSISSSTGPERKIIEFVVVDDQSAGVDVSDYIRTGSITNFVDLRVLEKNSGTVQDNEFTTHIDLIQVIEADN